MALTGGNWTGTAGNPPRNFAHPAAPKPLNAVEFFDNGIHGNLTENSQVGKPRAEDVAIFVDGTNLVDLITTLTARIAALETS